MPGKKEKLANIFSLLHLNEAICFIRGYLLNELKIIAYHRIGDIDSFNDRELVSATTEEFDWQVSYLKKYYNPMSFAQVISRLNNSQELPGNSVIITFDDGFADNYMNAYPVLKKHRVPATFFISTGYIGANETYWFNFISRIIMHNPGKSFKISSKQYQISDDEKQRLMLVPIILGVCKQVANSDRLNIIEDLKHQLNYVDDCDSLAMPMTWDNIREMSDNGMEFGSHTVSHPILSQLTSEEIKTEIHDSKSEIEINIGKEIHTISYPEGMDYAFNSETLNQVAKAGYILGSTYISGNNYKPELDDFLLKRSHIERYVDRPMFASMLSMPEIFC